jgi:nucleotide-binding universal stress UspA family protein
MSPQGPILVPLDGSALAERAVPVAGRLARRAHAGLLLVHVHARLTADPIHVEGLPVVDERLRSLRREHEQAYLDRVGPRLAPGADVSVALLDGPVAAALVGHAERSGAGLIVMTTHGRGGLERAWLGSVADEMVRVSRVPLLLLRPEPGDVPGPLRRILAPLDGTAPSESILEPALGLARLEDESELILLTVVQPATSLAWLPDPALGAPLTAPDADDPKGERARTYLEGVVRRLGASGVRVRARVEVAASIVPAILEVARAEGADVVALATHGLSGLERLALGSVADKLVRGSRTPVLLFKPETAATGGPLPPAENATRT